MHTTILTIGFYRLTTTTSQMPCSETATTREASIDGSTITMPDVAMLPVVQGTLIDEPAGWEGETAPIPCLVRPRRVSGEDPESLPRSYALSMADLLGTQVLIDSLIASGYTPGEALAVIARDLDRSAA